MAKKRAAAKSTARGTRTGAVRKRRTPAKHQPSRSSKAAGFRHIMDLGVLDRFVRGLDEYDDEGVERPSEPFKKIIALFAGQALISRTASAIPFEIIDSRTMDVVTDDPIADPFREPNPAMNDWSLFMEALVEDYYFGQAFVVPYLNGRPVKIQPGLVPDELRLCDLRPVKPRDQQSPLDIKGWKFRNSKSRQMLKRETPVRIPYKTTRRAPYEGVGPLEAAGLAIDAEWMAMIYQRATLARGGSAGTIISHKGNPDEFPDEEELRDMETNWQRKVASPRGGNGLAIVSGEWGVDNIGFRPRDISHLELRKFWISDAARILNLPPFFLAMFEGIGLGQEGLKQQWQQLFETNIIPFLEKVGRRLTLGIIRRYNPNFFGRFNLEAVAALREDLQAKQTVSSGFLADGWTHSQVAEVCDLPFDTNEKVMPWANEWIIGDTTATEIVERSRLPPVDLDAIARQIDAAAKGNAEQGTADGGDDAKKKETEPKASGAEPEVDKDSALNGAQITAAATLVTQIVTGELPRNTVEGLLEIGFNLTPEQVAKVIGSAKPDTNLSDAGGDTRAALRSAIASRIERTLTPQGQSVSHEKVAGRIPGVRAALPSKRKIKRLQERWTRKARAQENKVFRSARASLSEMQTVVATRLVRLNKQRGGAGARALLKGTRAADDPLHLTPADVVDLVELVTDKGLVDGIENSVREAYRAGVDSARDALLEIGVPRADLLDFQKKRLPQLVDGFVDTHLGGASPTTVTDDIRSAVNDVVLLSITNGDSVADAVKGIRTVFQASLSRARSIARTETAIAMGAARMSAMREHGVEKHMWLTMKDGSEREEHHDLHREIRVVGEDFLPMLAHPGDSRGGRSTRHLFINCRCTTVPLTRRQIEEQQEAA